MNNRIKKVIERLDDDLIKIITDVEFEVNEFLEDLYNDYINEIKEEGQPFDDEEFLYYVKEQIMSLKFINETFYEELDKIESSPFAKIRAYLSDRTELYRELYIPTYSPISELVYDVLASFGCIKGYDYKVKYKNNIFYPKKINMKKSGKSLNAEEEFLDDYNIHLGDRLTIIYDKVWKINVKVLKIEEKDKYLDISPILIKSNGQDILEGKRKLFDLLMTENFEEVKKLCKTEKYYNKIMKYYNKKDINISQIKFLKRIDEIRNLYEDEEYDLLDDLELDEILEDINDDELYNGNKTYEIEKEEFLKAREERNEKLLAKPHIKEYKHTKENFENILFTLNKFLEKHQEYYFSKLVNLLKNRNNDMSENIRFESLPLHESNYSLIMSCMIYPSTKEFESVSERFKKDKVFKGADFRMLETMIRSKLGFYQVIGYDYNNAYVYLKDVMTGEEIKIIDLNLSYGLNSIEDKLYILIRVFKTRNFNFAYDPVALFDDDEVQKFIQLIKKNKYMPIELYFLTLLIREKQMK